MRHGDRPRIGDEHQRSTVGALHCDWLPWLRGHDRISLRSVHWITRDNACVDDAGAVHLTYNRPLTRHHRGATFPKARRLSIDMKITVATFGERKLDDRPVRASYFVVNAHRWRRRRLAKEGRDVELVIIVWVVVAITGRWGLGEDVSDFQLVIFGWRHAER